MSEKAEALQSSNSIAHRLTGSKIWLSEHCRYWARSDVAVGRTISSSALRVGSGFHEVAELHPIDPDQYPAENVDEAFLGLVSDEKVDLDQIAEKWRLRPSEVEVVRDMYATWRLWWPEYVGDRGPVRREFPVAWDVKTWAARALKVNGPRDYSQCTPTEVPCTIDVCIGPEGGPVEVIDYKTGFLPVSAIGHLQGAACSLAIAHVLGSFPIKFTIVRVRRETVTTSSVVLNSTELDEVAASLQFWVEDIMGGHAEPQPGPYCDFCPAVFSCPHTHAVLDEIRTQYPPLRRAWFGPIQNNEQAARMRYALPILRAVIDEMDARLVDYAEANPSGITMPDGSVHRRVDGRRRALKADDSALMALLEQKFGVEQAHKLVTVKKHLSVGAVVKAAKALAPRGKKDDAAKEIIVEIEKNTSAMVTTTHRRWSNEDD